MRARSFAKKLATSAELCGVRRAAAITASPSAAPRALSTCPAYGIYPGNKKINYTTSLDTHAPEAGSTMEAYRVMDEDGTIRPGAKEPEFDRETCEKMYTTMIRLQTMDGIFYDAQRQGRISFYMTNWGEEGTHIGTAMALNPDDEIFAQYREAGVLMWRGFTLQQFADQLFSNEADLGKGRQMPVHYGSRDLHFHTISSPLATQLPQATGAAYACRLEGKGRVVTCYFGDGAASEGDFHAALNFAATLQAPVIFVCRNNGFAISTPVAEQYRGDGIAARGVAYGIDTIRVDGNDVFAVHDAMKKAREIANGGNANAVAPTLSSHGVAVDAPGVNSPCRPVLIEAMTYREGHHSTSDDSTRYRKPEEIQAWRENSNPVVRLRKYMERKGWWDADKDKALMAAERKAVLEAMTRAEQKPKPEIGQLFTDVYAGPGLPKHLQEQHDEMRAHVAKYPERYATAGH